jgi:hypothetical protein
LLSKPGSVLSFSSIALFASSEPESRENVELAWELRERHDIIKDLTPNILEAFARLSPAPERRLSSLFSFYDSKPMGYCGRYVVPVGFQSEKDFRTINVQWIGQWGVFARYSP